jgi:hypothetical protein
VESDKDKRPLGDRDAMDGFYDETERMFPKKDAPDLPEEPIDGKLLVATAAFAILMFALAWYIFRKQMF